MAEGGELDETIRSVEVRLADLRRQRDKLEQSIYAGERFLASLRGEQGESAGSARRRRSGKTNAEVLIEKLASAEPTGLLVSELVQALKRDGHRLANAADPVKATSNELAGMRRKGEVFKDSSTGRYRVASART